MKAVLRTWGLNPTAVFNPAALSNPTAVSAALSSHAVGLTRRTLLVGGACALSGCFGSFSALRKLWAWNDSLNDKWVKWLAFLGLSIIPVYQLFALADALVLNSVEFWTGRNPVARARDGRTLTRVALADPASLGLELRRDAQVEFVAVLRQSGDDTLEVLDVEGRLLSRVVEGGDGSLTLSSGQGDVLAKIDAGAAERLGKRAQAGESLALALRQELGPQVLELAQRSRSAGEVVVF